MGEVKSGFRYFYSVIKSFQRVVKLKFQFKNWHWSRNVLLCRWRDFKAQHRSCHWKTGTYHLYFVFTSFLVAFIFEWWMRRLRDSKVLYKLSNFQIFKSSSSLMFKLDLIQTFSSSLELSKFFKMFKFKPMISNRFLSNPPIPILDSQTNRSVPLDFSQSPSFRISKKSSPDSAFPLKP